MGLSGLTNRMHVVFRLVLRGPILADADAKEAVQPKIIGMIAHKARRSPELDHRRHLTAEKSLVAVFAEISHALIRDQNQRAIVGFKGCADIEIGHAIFPHRDPCTAYNTHLASNARSRNLPATRIE